jgi:hypothetical protein
VEDVPMNQRILAVSCTIIVTDKTAQRFCVAASRNVEKSRS